MQLIRTCRPLVFFATAIRKSSPESDSLGDVNPPFDVLGFLPVKRVFFAIRINGKTV